MALLRMCMAGGGFMFMCMCADCGRDERLARALAGLEYSAS